MDGGGGGVIRDTSLKKRVMRGGDKERGTGKCFFIRKHLSVCQ